MDLNKTWMGGNEENGTKRFQVMFLLMLDDSEQYSGIWNELKKHNLMGTYNYPKSTPLPMTHCAFTKIRRHNTKHIHQLGRWRSSSVMMQERARHSQETIGYHFWMSRTTAAREWDTMRETARHKHLILMWDHNHCRWYSWWPKQQTINQQSTLSIQIGSCCTNDPPSALSEIETSFKRPMPVI